ncbi:NAD-dependent epimerase/dehydratase family protein [Novosphingobium sp. KCTC 2891]|uniref:NAD-dependent epimerase/dehydratase family protein n=1 Tax=Novosphingobium sp. KCTC 2891 TaxID=2989730 RepID=UPI00222210EF|nr:NAD-dependent epimerase/dehydratase family protein [Novosphingobium sp. KCTC 2891]MCW1383179.1 NAD-dependent epimerase/dehydratase family protein [Novosphingobium sp. KCTC 2891]
MQHRPTVLVAGASGVIGQAAVAHFGASGEWDVLALSRRAPDVDVPCEHLAIDLTDAAACAAQAKRFSAVTHVIYAALYEKPGLYAGWLEQDQMERNLLMMRNLMEPLCAAATGLAHVSAFQGTKAYGAHVHQIAVPAREDAPRDPHANFYWLQEDYLRQKRKGADWSLTIWRPQIVFGGATGAAMNLIPVLGAYAAICRELGMPLAYPGRPGGVSEAVDADLIARALGWAATHGEAADQTLNITNGDVFAFANVWPAIARAVGLEPAFGPPFSLVDFLMEHRDTWARIAAREGLREADLEALMGESHHYADLLMGVHAPPDADRAPVLVSTVKLRKAGFADCEDTEEMFVRWLGRMAERGIIPAPAGAG